MNTSRRKAILSLAKTSLALRSAAVLGGLGPVVHASAQGGKVTQLLVGFPAGGGPDAVARALVPRLQQILGHDIIVVNRPGAGGRLALNALKAGPNDGSMMAIAPSGAMCIYPHMFKQLGYDVNVDFAPIAKICSYYMSLAVNGDSPHRTLDGLLDYCRRNPAQANCGVVSAGSSPHYYSYLLSKASGVSLTPVIYQGGPALTQNILGGQIPFGINVSSNFTELSKSGKLRLLATSWNKRSPVLPDVPTFIELGYKDVYADEFMGLIVKNGTPPEFRGKLESALLETLADPSVRSALLRSEFFADPMSAVNLSTLIKDNSARWAGIVRSANFKIEE